MRAIAQKPPSRFYGLLSEKEMRSVAILCSLVLASAAINGLIIVFSSKGL